MTRTESTSIPVRYGQQHCTIEFVQAENHRFLVSGKEDDYAVIMGGMYVDALDRHRAGVTRCAYVRQTWPTVDAALEDLARHGVIRIGGLS